jgi:hypothetical protein
MTVNEFLVKVEVYNPELKVKVADIRESIEDHTEANAWGIVKRELTGEGFTFVAA